MDVLKETVTFFRKFFIVLHSMIALGWIHNELPVHKDPCRNFYVSVLRNVIHVWDGNTRMQGVCPSRPGTSPRYRCCWLLLLVEERCERRPEVSSVEVSEEVARVSIRACTRVRESGCRWPYTAITIHRESEKDISRGLFPWYFGRAVAFCSRSAGSVTLHRVEELMEPAWCTHRVSLLSLSLSLSLSLYLSLSPSVSFCLPRARWVQTQAMCEGGRRSSSSSSLSSSLLSAAYRQQTFPSDFILFFLFFFFRISLFRSPSDERDTKREKERWEAKDAEILFTLLPRWAGFQLFSKSTIALAKQRGFCCT